MIQAWIAKLTFRTVAMIVAALLITAFLMWGPQACNNYFAAKTQVRLDHANVKAIEATTEGTLKTVDANADKAGTIDKAVEDGNNEIRQAPDGFSNDAALRASCRMRQYRNSERCAALREADTAKLEGRSPAR